MKRTSHASSRRLRRGVTTVEFALVVPIFFLIFFTFFEIWRFQQFQQAIDQAALDAARAAIVPGATVAQVRTAGTQLLDAVGAKTATIIVTPDPISESTDEVTVSIELPYSDVGLFYRYFASDYMFNTTLTLDTENKRIGRL